MGQIRSRENRIRQKSIMKQNHKNRRNKIKQQRKVKQVRMEKNKC